MPKRYGGVRGAETPRRVAIARMHLNPQEIAMPSPDDSEMQFVGAFFPTASVYKGDAGRVHAPPKRLSRQTRYTYNPAFVLLLC